MVRSRWSLIVAFALMGAATQVLWVTFAAVTDDAHTHYGVSKNAIGWLANVFPLFYVLLAIPAGIVLDRWFRGGLAVGAVLTAVGALLRLTGDSYGWVLFGQVVISLGQPLVLNAITGVTTRYLAEKDRPTGIAIGSASTFAGLVIGFGLGAALSHPNRMHLLVVIGAVLAVASAIVLLLALRAPASFEVALAPAGIGAFRVAWADPFIRRLCAVVFVPFGIFVTLSTFAQTLLKPAGVSDSTAGVILICNVVAGVIGCATVPVWATRRRREMTVLFASLFVTTTACAVLAAAAGVVTGFIAIAAIGFVLLPALPIVLEMTERRSGEVGGTATGLMWMAGNLGGLVVATVVGVIVDHPVPAFALLAVLTVLALPLVRRFGRYAFATPGDPAPAAPAG